MRYAAIALALLFCPLISARAQIGVGIGFPGINIGINVSAYPHLVPVPGYPIYYDPEANWNYFFYDGLYWVYQADNWYASSWYNGPWQLVGPEVVPLFVLRIPVRYYRQPPVYFRGWRDDAPPHWGEHWGRDWEARRRGWDQWDRRSAPPAAPLPRYQRQYTGDRYPHEADKQRSIQAERYRYKPREGVSQRQFQPQGSPARPSVRPQQQVTATQRSSSEQAHFPPNQQHQQPQPRQRPQTGPQDRGQGSRAAPQDRARKSRIAPKDTGRENESAPKDRNRENKNDGHGPAPRLALEFVMDAISRKRR